MINDGPVHWSRRARDLAAIIWSSFLCACVATMVFFALVDPDGLVLAAERPRDWQIHSIYAAGFFFFWAVTLSASVLTAWLIRTGRRRDDFPT